MNIIRIAFILLLSLLITPKAAFAHGEQVFVMLISWGAMIVVVSVIVLVFWKETATTKSIVYAVFWVSIISLFSLPNPLAIILPSSMANYFGDHPICGAFAYTLESIITGAIAYYIIRIYRKWLPVK